MGSEKCIIDPDRECIGNQKANEVEHDLNSFKESVGETINRFGTRIGKLEAAREVQEEQYKNFKEKIKELSDDISRFQIEQKGSISDLRSEHRESMNELKRSNKEILDIVTPLKHKMDEVDKLQEDVDTLKSKPAQTWEDIKKQGLGWIVGIILAIVAVALGLKNYM